MDPIGFDGDPVRALKALPVSDLDPRLAREVRDRAVALMARRGRRPVPWVGVVTATCGRLLEPLLVGGLSLGFAAWVVARSIETLQQARGGYFWH